MKKLISAILAILITSYCGLWWHTAGELKATTVAQIQHLNQLDGITFSYNQLRIEGFPWRILAQFENAKLSVNPSAHTRPVINNKTLIEFDAPLTLQTAILSKRATLTSNKLHITTGDQSYNQQGQRQLTVTFFNIRSNEPLVNQIKAIEFQRDRIQSTNTNNQPQVIAQPLHVNLQRTSLGHDQERYTLNIDGHYADEVSAEQMLINSVPYLNLFSAPEQTNKTPLITTENNLINADITVQTFSLPTLARWLALGQVGEVYLSDELLHTPPTVDINNLTIRTPWFNWQANYHSDIQRKVDQQNVNVKLHSKFTMAPVGQHILDQLLDKITLVNTDEEIRSSIQGLFPNLVSMGTIQCDVVLKSTPHQLQLKDLNLSNQHYGITGNLNVRHKKSGSAEFKLRNYPHMIDDATAYITTLNKLTNHLQVTNTNISFAPNFTKQLNQLLRKISTKPNSDDKNITLKVKYDGQQYSVGSFDHATIRKELRALQQNILIHHSTLNQHSQPLPYINDQSFFAGDTVTECAGVMN